jgi:hypothetical protein
MADPSPEQTDQATARTAAETIIARHQELYKRWFENHLASLPPIVITPPENAPE